MIQIVNLEDDSGDLSEIKYEITEFLEITLVKCFWKVSNLKIKLEFQNNDIKTSKEFRLLQFAAKEEKSGQDSYPA